MVQIQLNRDFMMSGSNIKEFLDAVRAMQEITKPVIANSRHCIFAHILDGEEDCQDVALTAQSPETLAMTSNSVAASIAEKLKTGSMMTFRCQIGQKFGLAAVSANQLRSQDGMNEQLFDELCTRSKMLLLHDGAAYIVSDLAFSTFNNRAKLGGDAMGHPSVGRTTELARSLFYKRPQNIQLITRCQGETKTVIAAHSEKYCYVPQTVLCEIYDKIARDFGRSECLYWEVSHEISRCYIGFPDIANDFAEMYKLPHAVIPGLYFSTSDSGDGSLTVRGVWDVDGHIVGGEVLKRNHRGEINVEEFVEKAWKTIHAKYNSIPQRLAELLTIDVPNPQATLKAVFKEIEAAKSANLGKKASQLLYDELCREFDASSNYTAYDLAMAIASVPERCIGMHFSMVEKMEALAFKAIFANYHKSAQEDPSFVLA